MKKRPKKRAPGGGRKPTYGEPTIKVDFRCPKSKVKEFRTAANKILSSYKISKNG